MNAACDCGCCSGVAFGAFGAGAAFGMGIAILGMAIDLPTFLNFMLVSYSRTGRIARMVNAFAAFVVCAVTVNS